MPHLEEVGSSGAVAAWRAVRPSGRAKGAFMSRSTPGAAGSGHMMWQPGWVAWQAWCVVYHGKHCHVAMVHHGGTCQA